jgi:hypothetical protein
MLAKFNTTGSQLIAQVTKGYDLRIFELLPKEGFLVHRKLLPLIFLIGVGSVDIGMRLGELGCIPKVLFAILHNFDF